MMEDLEKSGVRRMSLAHVSKEEVRPPNRRNTER